MKMFQAASAVFCLALLGSVLATPVQADEMNRKTTVTFSAPVEIPGVHLKGWGVLPAGTYVFKILSSQSDRHIVQIFNADETSLYATILAIPNYRLKATDKTVMTFRERAAGEPEALRAWFYPGRNWGEEFVYPKSKAVVLAKAANTPVLFTAVEIPMEVPGNTLVLDAPVLESMKRAPIMAFRPTGEEIKMAEVVTAPPVEVASAQEPNMSKAKMLPATAGFIPLFALMGLMALAGGIAVRVFAKQS